ncbi:MAG: adenylyltransferase/cytidyltransferase family protein [Simkaniaceae bacterium]|nr:MAG: adenylyltransferase/cytidyltransferase family protein [Simkaniaceae bacterium]
MKPIKLLLLILFSTTLFAKPVRVYVDVVGDLFHAGHVQFFQKAKAHGDYLIVGIHGDDACTDYKREPILTLEERRIAIEACRFVDEVILNSPIGITQEWIQEHDIDLVIHGDDFSEEKKRSQYAVPIKMGIFKTVPYTPGISTTEIISRINSRR